MKKENAPTVYEVTEGGLKEVAELPETAIPVPVAGYNAPTAPDYADDPLIRIVPLSEAGSLLLNGYAPRPFYDVGEILVADVEFSDSAYGIDSKIPAILIGDGNGIGFYVSDDSAGIVFGALLEIPPETISAADDYGIEFSIFDVDPETVYDKIAAILSEAILSEGGIFSGTFLSRLGFPETKEI